MDCLFSGLLAPISVVGCRAGLRVVSAFFLKLASLGPVRKVIFLFDLNYASPGPETSVTMDSPLWSLRKFCSPLLCPSSPVVRWVVHLSAGPGVPGRHPRVLCDLRLSSRAGRWYQHLSLDRPPELVLTPISGGVVRCCPFEAFETNRNLLDCPGP
jgi:hypothetical protein